MDNDTAQSFSVLLKAISDLEKRSATLEENFAELQLTLAVEGHLHKYPNQTITAASG